MDETRRAALLKMSARIQKALAENIDFADVKEPYDVPDATPETVESLKLRLAHETYLRECAEGLNDEMAAQVEQANRNALRMAQIEAQLAEARANDRTAMGYLGDVLALVGGDDFPSMIQRVAELNNRFKSLSELHDARINEITYDELGQWPSFEAQRWACKVVHAVLSDHGLDAHTRAQDVSSTPAACPDQSTAKPVAITMADHIAGEYGYCKFKERVAFGTQLYIASACTHVAITLADHEPGEMGRCKFLVPLAFSVELYAAPNAAETDREPAAP